MKMLAFVSNSKYALQNRGDVYVVQGNGNLYRRELLVLKGRTVAIDNKIFKVIAVEKNVLAPEVGEKITRPFGILVGPEIRKEKRLNESHYIIRVSSPLHDGDFINHLDKVPGFEKASIYCMGNDRRRINSILEELDELFQ